MFRLTFDTFLSPEGLTSHTIFCSSFVTYKFETGEAGGQIFTRHINGQKKHWIAYSDIKVATI